MSEKAIVFGITADHAFAAGALLASILKHDPDFDATVVIFHDGLPESQKAAFLCLWPRCQFRRFSLADIAARLGVAVDDAGLELSVSRSSPLVLAKLELPGLLDDFAQVLWLDADILVRGPLQPVWNFDCIAWRPLPQGAFQRREKVLAAFAEWDRDPSVPLLNGGVIGLSRGFLKRGGSARVLHDMARELVLRTQTTQLDEMSWYLTAATLGLPVTPLPMRFNHPVGARGVSDAVVVHAIGAHKFWNVTPLLQLFPDWSAHHATWAASGGAPYAGKVELGETHPAEISDVLRFAETRAYWLSVFDRLRADLPPGMVVDLRHDQIFLRIFLHGRPAAQHLRLVRQTNLRRLGLEVHLPDALTARILQTVCQTVPGALRDKGPALSVPIGHMTAALAVAATVVSNG